MNLGLPMLHLNHGDRHFLFEWQVPLSAGYLCSHWFQKLAISTNHSAEACMLSVEKPFNGPTSWENPMAPNEHRGSTNLNDR